MHDLGVVKALGMTPRQTIRMVTCWILAPAVGAAIIGLPAGMSLQNTIINAIGRGQTATGTLPYPRAAWCTSTRPVGWPCSPWPGW